MSKIRDLRARELLDSRGNPTIEVEVELSNGDISRAIAPSGASTGKKEAFELRDNDQTRFCGRGILKAVASIDKIRDEIVGCSPNDYKKIDQIIIDLDGTANKSFLGSNATIATSLAILKSAAKLNKLELFELLLQGNVTHMPVPLVNILNGGAHADNKISIQEFMIVPFSATSIRDAIRISAEIYHNLRDILKDKNLGYNVGDEGGFAPIIHSSIAALDIICMAVEKAGYEIGNDIFFALDVAASELYKNNKYYLADENNFLSSDELMSFYQTLQAKYPIFSIEDPFDEDDDDAWKVFNNKSGRKLQIVGDDLFATNVNILKDKFSLANSILIKPNQVGTFSECEETVVQAKKNNYNTIISHRSGETEDTTIAHLSVGFDTMQIKTGSVCRTDRVAKYNELIRIEEKLGPRAIYAGQKILSQFK